MDQELERILTNLKDAGCGSDKLKTAERVFRTGDADALIRYLRRCRCGLMEELHESQRRVDCLDYLIRQTEKAKAMRSL